VTLIVLALSCTAATAQISVVEIQRNTECMDMDSGTAVNEQLIGTGPWTSNISLQDVGIAHSVQETDVQLDGSALTSSGILRTSVEMEEETEADHLYSWSRVSIAVAVEEESEYAFTLSMSEGVLVFLGVSGEEGTVIDDAGDYFFEGTLAASDQIAIYVEATVDEVLDGVGSFQALVDYDFSITPTTVATRAVGWSALKSMYR
jgi:hypothetical protein